MCWNSEDYKVYEGWKGQVAEAYLAETGRPLDEVVGDRISGDLIIGATPKTTLFQVYKPTGGYNDEPYQPGTTPQEAVEQIVKLTAKSTTPPVLELNPSLDPLGKREAVAV